MNHPYHLHAIAAAWSLTASTDRLHALAVDEARTAGAELVAAAPISSRIFGVRRSIGGHADPTGSTTLGTRTTIDTSWRDLADRADRRVRWLAEQVAGDLGRTHPHPLPYLRQLIPGLPAARAGAVARHLQDDDAWIRGLLRLDPDRWMLPGAECPACGVRPMWARTVGPDRDWTVVCPGDCRCIGSECGCGMPVRPTGVVHVWDRTAPLVARALGQIGPPLAA